MKFHSLLIISIFVIAEVNAQVPAACVNVPQLTSTTGGTYCGTGNITLSATTNLPNEIKWYETTNAGVMINIPIATGNSYTAQYSRTTTMYAAATYIDPVSLYAGPQNLAAVGTAIDSTNMAGGQYLNFTVATPIWLKSVDMINSVFQYRPDSGYQHKWYPHTITITGTPFTGTFDILEGTRIGNTTTVPINVMLPAGSYTMKIQIYIYPFKYNPTGAIYPHTRGPVSITGAFPNPNAYYFFYNWKFSHACEGAKVPVVANIIPTYEIFWTGKVDNSFENSGNWSCPQVPGMYNNVTIPDGSTVVINSNVTVKSMNVGNANVIVNSGYTLTVLKP